MKKILAITNQSDSFHDVDGIGEDLEIDWTANRLTAIEKAQSGVYDRFLVDLDFYREFYLKLYREPDPEKNEKINKKNFKDIVSPQKIILLVNSDEIDTAIELIKNQVSGYLSLPFQIAELKLLIHQLETKERRTAEIEYFRDRFWHSDVKSYVFTENTLMKDVYSKIKDVAPTKSTVLLCGDTGAGKGLMAKMIHAHSSRKDTQFIHVHCGAIPEPLIESELFGHEKGAFTGALKRKIGKFELAHRGTVFLDEISTLSPSAQIKLLQVLQDSVFQRVGGESDVKVDIRVIAATNEDLKELSDEGRFRKDLYYRLNVFPVPIPSLRDRKEDLPHLINVFIEKLNKTYPKNITGIQPEALQTLVSYDWPGNIRELENLIERAYILEKTSLLTTESFPIELAQPDPNTAVLPLNIDLPLAEARNRVIENFERQYLKEILQKTNGKINESAKIAGITPRQINKLMNKYSLLKEDFKQRKGIPFSQQPTVRN